ncbi:MAG: Wzz/FepE/Etk N-terminal domain-containing protein [Reichenbachiella sp.]|uniref:Wzz/FepE/Etk N-terminal domain-containing protein n=1 Tax=Reichenbachiella sp. TaxID=2184521 RepID=UPI003267A052
MNKSEDNKVGELDLLELAKTIWFNKFRVFKLTCLFVLLGFFVALFSPIQYTSTAVLMPETQQQAGGAGELLQKFGGSLGLGGLDLSGMQSGTIPPMLYPKLVNSNTFQAELLSMELTFEQDGITTTLPDYYKNHYDNTLVESILSYTIGLPGTIRKLIVKSNNKTSQKADGETTYTMLSAEELENIEANKVRIGVTLDEETGLLYCTSKLTDARAAADLNQNVIDLLKKQVTEYKIEKIKSNLNFVENQYDDAKSRFINAQAALADFNDKNINISTSRQQTKYDMLQDEKNIAFNVYNSISQRLEQTKLQLQEETPVFKILEPVSVPPIKSSARKIVVILGFTLFGLIIGVSYVLLKEPIVNIIKQITES